MRRLALLGVLVVTVGAAAASAMAAKPVVVERNNELVRGPFTGVDVCQAYGYDFLVTIVFQVRRTVTDFYSNDGTLLRERVHVNFVGSETNETTGKSIPVNGTRNIVFDFVNGTFIETGVLRHVTVPGEGIVLHESGRIITGLETEDVSFMAGPHQLFAGDESGLCAALASP